jgi:hypothetical protein
VILVFQKIKPSRNVRIAIVAIVIVLFVVYEIWNLFFR